MAQMDPDIPVMVLPGTDWSFQVYWLESRICDKLKHQKGAWKSFLLLERACVIDSLSNVKMKLNALIPTIQLSISCLTPLKWLDACSWIYSAICSVCLLSRTIRSSAVKASLCN